MLIDSHAHITELSTGVDKVVNIGASLVDSRTAIELAQKYENIFATVGIHPNDNPTATADNVDWNQFEALAKMPKVVGIGETGLDYSRTHDRERQMALFQQQIDVAKKLDLPLSIHVRDAWDDILLFDLSNNRGVFHCYSGPAIIPFDFYVSFAGNVTFKNAKALQELARLIPPERLLVETDSPYLAPEPLRGSQNVPGNVKLVAAKLAELRDVTIEEIEEITSKNAEKLFGI